LDTSETSKPLLSAVSFHLSAFFSAGIDGVNDWAFPVGSKSILVNEFEEGERIEMGKHPLVKIVDIRDCIDDATGTKYVCILCQEGRRDDAGFVLARLEVGIREKKEKSG
jgi:hypothetical protein